MHLKYPEFIDGLVLVAGSYKMPVNQDLIDLAEAGDDKAILLMMKWGYEGSKAFIGGNPVKKIINSSREIIEILSVDLNACNNYKSGKESLEKINCPTLCIFGDLDKMVPLKVGNKMSELIKNSETKVITDCGHMIIFEKAFEMRKIVKRIYFKTKKMKKFNIAKSRRLRSTPYSSRIESQGVTAYTIYNHMLLPAAFGSLEDSYHHFKRACANLGLLLLKDK